MSISTSAFLVINLLSAISGGVIAYILFYFRYGRRVEEFSRQQQIVTYLQDEVFSMRDREKTLIEKLSTLEKEMLEISHYVEFRKPNVAYALLAVVGTNDATREDLVALRQAGVDALLSYPPTLDVFEKRINNLRATDRMPQAIHFGLHADTGGIRFEDRVATIEWLSENISDVGLILVAGCNGSEIGFSISSSTLRVITVQNNIGAEHAALLTRVFWEQIANGKNVLSAFTETKRRLPPSVRELIEMH